MMPSTMRQITREHRHRTEHAMIDALLTIAKVVKKIEVNRMTQSSKRKIDDYRHEQQTYLPVPSSMKTLDSCVTNLTDHSLQQPLNCNRALSCHRLDTYELDRLSASFEHEPSQLRSRR
jgi:hypothetical protein